MARQQHPISYQLGQHTLEWSDDAQLTLGNETVAIELEQEEAYRLHLVLQSLFMQQDHPTSKGTLYATC
ncbi:MAG TPA: hypothetical protein VKY19_22295 [Ktedonosporobacter sp.]|jgi:hypothetical protein|nr:hypothetical protein [Ktedonosporobacter sp.]